MTWPNFLVLGTLMAGTTSLHLQLERHPQVFVPALLNLQEVRGEAKPYQIRQFLRIIERYNLQMEASE